MSPEPVAPEVLHRDKWVLVINKPSGLLTHRGWANDRVTALSVARDFAGRHVHAVHRLDRATSGALLFALDPESAAVLRAELDAGGFEKRYLALVRGVIADAVEVDHPLASEPGEERKPARTSVRPLACFERYSLVEATPHTGRTHQIRRHLKHLSHPVIGDTRYGSGEHNRAFRERFGLHRLALHAARLAFTHPSSAARIDLRAPLTADLAEPLQAMGLLEQAATAVLG
ncbi:MAG TPA: pseudouridine synthase [Polyangiales bacterium]|nr:pseudouridine synthase [Polyangiales bacterium]